MQQDQNRFCDGCGQPIPKKSLLSTATLTAGQVDKLRVSGKLRSEPEQLPGGLLKADLCLQCQIDLRRM